MTPSRSSRFAAFLRQPCNNTVANRRHNEKRDGLVDENRVKIKENKNNRAVFMFYLFAYNIKPMSK